MSLDLLGLGLIWYVVLLFTTVLHEGAHAFVARRLGDPTAYHEGHATLDPRPHLRRSPVGMVVVPLLSFFLNRGAWMIGWASVPYDPMWADRRPRRAALMSLAGPSANLLLAAAAFACLKGGLGAGLLERPPKGGFDLAHLAVSVSGAAWADALAVVLSVVFSLNVILGIFNLLPVPPLDGSGVPPLFLDEHTARRYHRFMWHPGFQMGGLLVAWVLFGRIWAPIFGGLLALLYG